MMHNFWRTNVIIFVTSGLLSCGEGLYQKRPEGVASTREEAFLYVGHRESIRFTGKGLNGARFTVSPDLPDGLSISSKLPGIVGTPTAAQILTDYRVSVTSDFGETSFTFSIKVNPSTPTPEILRDIFTGGPATPVILGHIGEEILFAADSNVEGRELWKTDGATAGTVLVSDIDNGVGLSGSPVSLWQTQNAYPFEDLIFFAAETAGGGVELYKTDGTTAGTVLASVHEPTSIAKVGTRFVFSGNDAGGIGVEPFAVDASGGSLINLADIDAGGDSSPDLFTELDGQVFFFATEPATGKELYVTDGTPAGTSLVLEINTGAGSSAVTSPPIAFGDFVYFAADDGLNGVELWRSNGMAAGTTLVKDIASGGGSSDPEGLVVFNGVLYFTADDGVNGLELWRSDGTAAGTYMVKDINVSGSASVTLFRNAADSLYMYFTADNGSSGNELWRTNGTGAGTELVADIDFGVGSSSPQHLTMVSGVLFFSAATAAAGRELWKSDGSAIGTEIVEDLNLGAADGIQPTASFYEFQGVLYFAGATAASDIELFKVTPY